MPRSQPWVECDRSNHCGDRAYNQVSKSGEKLSGGQRQRLAITRAILKDPPILILDEATSAVDNETEAAIQKSLQVITQNRTTIAIAHRLSTIRHADCIYVMERGQFIESGTHEPLLALDGIYARLWQVQSGIGLDRLEDWAVELREFEMGSDRCLEWTKQSW